MAKRKKKTKQTSIWKDSDLKKEMEVFFIIQKNKQNMIWENKARSK